VTSEATQPSRFFDVASGGDLQLQLEPVGAGFRILRQFGYRDPEHPEPFVVPRRTRHFHTDLASIPWFFAWLIPGIGTHLPAVLVHDALVVHPGDEKAYIGPDVDREEADRILRDAMASLGTPVVRRWLMWTAVIIATALTTFRPRWYWRLVVVGTLVLVGVLGVLASLDVVDAWDVLPWMGDRPWSAELVLGTVAALVIPAVLAVLWGHIRRAGVIAGVSLALLLHVTVGVVLAFGVYWLIEAVVSGRSEGGSPSARQNLEEAT
jgi:hypothetical protein